MPYVNFGTKDEPAFELIESPDLVAVRTRSKRSVQGEGPVPRPPAALVDDGVLVAEFPDAGVEVYQVPTAHLPLEERKRALRVQPDVRFAGSVLVDAATNEPVLYTENLYIRFKEDIDEDDCEAIIRAAGLSVKERLDIATNAYWVAAPEGTGQRVFDLAQELLARPDVIYCHPELIRERRYKEVFPQQWHLKPTSVNNVVINAHANVEAAHGTTRGAGITIAVIDDGVAVEHPEFSTTGKVVAPRDVTQGVEDPRPKFNDDNHGTACAGVACAGGIKGASGVAPLARLMPIRLASGLGSVQEAKAFRWAADNGADVISCSWGPADGKWWNSNDPLHNQSVPLPASTRDAIDYAVTTGRGGKGCVVLFAAGNGRESVDLDGYASYANVIAVVACNDRSTRSVYSDFGKAAWCAFPSSDFGHAPFGQPDPLTPGIWTTDRPGTDGYNSGNPQFGDAAGLFANDFGGTSSACPGAAGVAALVLSANRNLTWKDVKGILRRSCDRIDPQGGQYDAHGHSTFYGYGRLNAFTAVELARQSVSRVVIFEKLTNLPIPDLGSVAETVDATESEPVEKVAVSVRLEHTYIGDLLITITPPPGGGMSPVVLHNRAGGGRDNLDMVYDAANRTDLAAYSGKKCKGVWTIRVDDKAAQDSGKLLQFGVHLFFPPPTPERTSVIPEEVTRRVPAATAAKKKVSPKRPKKRTVKR